MVDRDKFLEVLFIRRYEYLDYFMENWRRNEYRLQWSQVMLEPDNKRVQYF